MAIRTRWPTLPTYGRLPATAPHAIRTGSWLAPEAPTDLRFRRRFVAALCVTVGVLSLIPLAELAARTYRTHRAAPARQPVAAPRALPYPQLELPLAINGSQYLPLAWSDIPGWSEDDHLAAFQTFRASCKPIAAQDAAAGPADSRALGAYGRDPCLAAPSTQISGGSK